MLETITQDELEPEESGEIVEIDHPIHGVFELDVPVGMSDEEIIFEVNNLDLDLALGVPKDGGVGTTDLTFITAHENAASAGLRDGKWYKFNNAAGNNEVNIGAGSVKLTADELARGTMSIGGKEVDFTGGITSEQSDELTKERIASAESIALASLVKVGMNLDKDKVTALTSLIYNVGAGAWAESRAKKFLEAGNIEDFMHEAFSEESGWVHIAGKKSKGLIRRRAAEAERFGHTQVAAEESSPIKDMIVNALEAINPISSAKAGEFKGSVEQDFETQGPRFPSPTRKPEMPTQGADLGPEALRGITPGIKPEITAPPTEGKPTEDEQDLWGILTSTPVRAAITDQIHKFTKFIPGARVIESKDLPQEQISFASEVVAKKIKSGKFTIKYDFDKAGARDVGHGSNVGIPDLRGPAQNLKFFLGAVNIVRHGQRVYLADEYDYNWKLDLRDQSYYEKIGDIFQQYQRFNKGEVGAFSVVDAILERFQSKPGEGMSVRLDMGSAEELGLSEEEFNKIPTLSSYEDAGKRDKRIYKENIGWRPSTTTTVAEGQDNLQGGAGDDTLGTVAEVANTVGEFIGPGADVRDLTNALVRISEGAINLDLSEAGYGVVEALTAALGIAIPGSQKIKAAGQSVGKLLDDAIEGISVESFPKAITKWWRDGETVELFHGTNIKNIKKIKEKGIQPDKDGFSYVSPDPDTGFGYSVMEGGERQFGKVQKTANPEDRVLLRLKVPTKEVNKLFPLAKQSSNRSKALLYGAKAKKDFIAAGGKNTDKGYEGSSRYALTELRHEGTIPPEYIEGVSVK